MISISQNIGEDRPQSFRPSPQSFSDHEHEQGSSSTVSDSSFAPLFFSFYRPTAEDRTEDAPNSNKATNHGCSLMS